MDAHVGGDDSQEESVEFFGQNCTRRTRATRQCGGSHVHHGVMSLHGFGLERMSKHPLHTR